jgi:glycosyltransferase involved in cell wall biosynthesis
MKKNYKLNIVLPVYNPHKGWKDEFIHSLNKLQEELSDVDYCITIVNDGSTCDIETIVEKDILPVFSKLNYLSYQVNQGKGYAIRYGLEQTLSDYYIYTDFDFPFGYHSVKETYDKLAEGSCNLVIGTRDHTYLKALPLERRLISKGLMIVNYFITRFRVKDTQAGLKGIDNKARVIFLTNKTNGFIFELEFILKCLKANIKYSFINVVPNPVIKFTNFSSNILIRELKNYLKITFGK